MLMTKVPGRGALMTRRAGGLPRAAPRIADELHQVMGIAAVKRLERVGGLAERQRKGA